MSGRLLASDATRHELSDLIDPGVVVDGDPIATELAFEPLGTTNIGVWSLTPGIVQDVEVDEVFVVVSGRGTVRFDDGESIDLVPGVIVRLREGDRTEWVITETLRKVYIAR